MSEQGSHYKQDIQDIQELQDLAEISRKSRRAEIPRHLPLSEFIRWALENEPHYQSRRPGQANHSPMWGFVRLMRAHPQISDADAETALAAVRAAVGDETMFSSHFQIHGSEVNAQFINDWPNVKFIPGEDPLEQALARARRIPLKPEEPRPATEYSLFVSIAGWLQVIMGDHPIYLPLERVATLMDRSFKTIAIYRGWAQEDGYLRLVKKHSRAKGIATEFRFATDRFDVLRRAVEATIKSDAASFDVGAAFEAIWAEIEAEKIPTPEGRDVARERYIATVQTANDAELCCTARRNYTRRAKSPFIKKASTWFADWRAYIDFDGTIPWKPRFELATRKATFDEDERYFVDKARAGVPEQSRGLVKDADGKWVSLEQFQSK